jgi:hypothetical protein
LIGFINRLIEQIQTCRRHISRLAKNVFRQGVRGAVEGPAIFLCRAVGKRYSAGFSAGQGLN